MKEKKILKNYNKKFITIFTVYILLTSTIFLINISKPVNAMEGWIDNSEWIPGVTHFGNSTTDLTYDPDKAVFVTINTTGLKANDIYYLFKPVYACDNYSNPSEFYWSSEVVKNPDGYPIEFITHPTDTTNKKATSSYAFYLDRAGMWCLDNDLDHDPTDPSTFDSFIWVNTSEEYIIDPIEDFYYGSADSKTITVTTTDNDNYIWIDLLYDGTIPPTLILHRVCPTNTLTFDTDLNITNIGIYIIRAYKDLDLFWDTDTPYNYGGKDTWGYNNTHNFTLKSYNYDYNGPWDPPEKNATEIFFRVNSTPPNPPTISGPKNGKVGEKYEYTLQTTDPDKDNITYQINWGDNTFDFAGYVPSGTQVTLNHTWKEQGKYVIIARAFDEYRSYSDWTTLEVSMPRNKDIKTSFSNLLKNFPIIFKILQQIIKL